MTFFDKAGYYVRYAKGMHEYLRLPHRKDWEARIRHQVENRETIWLETMRRAVFGRDGNPYRRMFELAGCTHDDLTAALKRDGLEPTLASLHRAGVYLAHDEFKGKRPIVRSGEEIPSKEDSFANPLVSGGIESRSGGSRSRGTKTRKSGVFRQYTTAYRALQVREFGLTERSTIIVSPILPSSSGFGNCVQFSRHGSRIDSWFSAGSGHLSDSAHYHAFTNFLVLLARANGIRVPFPTHLPVNDFSAPAARVAELIRGGGRCMLKSSVSGAVRVAAAAVDKGFDISGTIFIVGGEALTESKRRVIESAGVEVYPGYTVSEVGNIGFACRQMKSGNCVHLFRDAVAAINYRKQAPLADTEVNSLLFTTLLPMAPNLFINAEMDDAGNVEPARCECSYTALGLCQQISDIGSYGKLTGQGMTLIGTQVVQVLEEVLPARFGGGPTDFQLVEREGERQTQLVLRVSPRVPVKSTDEVKDVFLREIRRFQGGASASRMWWHSDGFEVVRAEPLATMRGKVLSLHLLRGSEAKVNAS